MNTCWPLVLYILMSIFQIVSAIYTGHHHIFDKQTGIKRLEIAGLTNI